MKTRLFTVAVLFSLVLTAQNPVTGGPDWTVSNITADDELDYPNTIIYGPDNMLWITEREGKKVVKVSPDTGINSKSTMLDISSLVYQDAGQDGLMGMAIHPALYDDISTTTNNYVYLAYTYDDDPDTGVTRKLRIERYTYNSVTGNLDSGSATTIIEDLDATNDHNSGKLKIGPDMKLYYTAGDTGANQFANRCNEIRSQMLPTQNDVDTQNYYSYQGKILRLNLDGTIPTDNPLFNSVKSHIYSCGHRNPQGLVFGSNGILYSSEHGPKTDDELNIVESGMNYGWPEIAGYYDNMAYKYCNTSAIPGCDTDTSCDNSSGVAEFTSGMPSNFAAPIGTYNSTTATQPPGGWFTYPTIAPSSLDIYEGGLIPDWGTSLLIPTLKKGTIYRAKLNASGTDVEDVNNNNDESDDYEEFHSSDDRYRDVIAAPDGVTFYAITDNTGGTSGPSGTSGVTIENPGVIVKIQYVGNTLSNNDVTETVTLNLSPNPSNGEFKLNFDDTAHTSFNIRIRDIHGRVVFNENSISRQEIISASTLKNGLYLISVLNENNHLIGTKKLVISN